MLIPDETPEPRSILQKEQIKEVAASTVQVQALSNQNNNTISTLSKDLVQMQWALQELNAAMANSSSSSSSSAPGPAQRIVWVHESAILHHLGIQRFSVVATQAVEEAQKELGVGGDPARGSLRCTQKDLS